jgi:hypothetical protein
LQVGNRWDEFSAEEHSQLGTLAYNMLKSGVGRPTPHSRWRLVAVLHDRPLS